MRGHVSGLIVKFLMCTVILYLVLGLIFGDSLTTVLLLSAVVTLVSYIVGDLIVLPLVARSTKGAWIPNLVATALDFFLAYGAIRYVGANFIDSRLDWTSRALYSAIIIAIGELFFHHYLRDKIIGSEETV